MTTLITAAKETSAKVAVLLDDFLFFFVTLLNRFRPFPLAIPYSSTFLAFTSRTSMEFG